MSVAQQENWRPNAAERLYIAWDPAIEPEGPEDPDEVVRELRIANVSGEGVRFPLELPDRTTFASPGESLEAWLRRTGRASA